MRLAIGLSTLCLIAGCQTLPPPFPMVASGPITQEELVHSFDEALSVRLIVFTTADRDCTLSAAQTLATEAGEPDAGNAANLPQVYVEGSGGLQKVDNKISNRELLAARLVGQAARGCQIKEAN